jgi:hypothetical protein
MKSWRIGTAAQVARVCVVLSLVATAGCETILGIEPLTADDPATSDGASDSGSAEAGDGGYHGDVSIDAIGPDGRSDASTPPPVDATSDVAHDISADASLDASDDRVPDGVADAFVDSPRSDVFAPDGADGDGPARDGNLADVSDASAPEGGPDASKADAALSDAPSDRSPTITVQGRIIDYWRHVVPAVPVTIGTTTVHTDANGQFTISGVAPPYDVAFTISTVAGSFPASYGWLYKGLTRVDPTLEVWDAFPTRSATELSVQVTGIDFANYPSNQSTMVAFGSADGAFSTDVSAASSLKPSSWYGPTSTNMTGHALTWLRASSSFSALPTSYLSYDTQPAPLVDMGTSSVAFDLANRTIASGSITGTVTPSASGGARENGVYVRFASNANIRLVVDASQPTSFSYLVPTLAGGSITLAASQGYWSTPPYAVVHRDDLSGQTGIAMTIPDACSFSSPVSGATGVNTSTVFRWSGSPKVFVWSLVSDAEFKSIFVVTTEQQGTIPSLPGGPTLPANAGWSSYVETNGSFQSVDEATGTGGMLDAFGMGDPGGAFRGNGTFTRSQRLRFTTAQ